MSLDATVGGASANSVATVAEADAYFLNRLHSGLWSTASKEAALITGTRLIQDGCRFIGDKATDEQALDWPRTGVYDRDGFYVSELIIPEAVKNGVFEMAYAMLESDITVDSPLKRLGLKSGKVSSLNAVAADYIEQNPIPNAAWAALGEFAYKPGSGQIPTVR